MNTADGNRWQMFWNLLVSFQLNFPNKPIVAYPLKEQARQEL